MPSVNVNLDGTCSGIEVCNKASGREDDTNETGKCEPGECIEHIKTFDQHLVTGRFYNDTQNKLRVHQQIDVEIGCPLVTRMESTVQDQAEDCSLVNTPN